jgi:hypothetical protein
VSFGNRNHVREGDVTRAAHRALEPKDCGGLGRDGSFQFPLGCTRRIANFNHPDPDLSNRMIIAVSVGAVDNDLIF